MITSLNTGSPFQLQTTYYRGASTAHGISASGQNGIRASSSSSDSRVNISSAAQSRLANEQQTPDTTQSAILPVGIKHMLEQMVDDPAYAQKYADGYANNIHTACMSLPEFMRGQGALESGRNQLQTAWQNIQNEGETPAQGYAELLKYELSMPQSYWNAQDPGHTMPNIRDFAEAKLAYLEQYMTTK